MEEEKDQTLWQCRQYCSADNQSLMFACAAWWPSLTDIQIIRFAECSKCRLRVSLPCKRSKVVGVFVRICVWFYRIAGVVLQCKAQHRCCISPGQVGCSYCSCLTCWILLPPYRQHSLQQQPQNPTDASSGLERPLQRKAWLLGWCLKGLRRGRWACFVTERSW